MKIDISWTEFKDFVDNLSIPIMYIETSDEYYLYSYNGTFQLHCSLSKGNAESSDFETNYKPNANNKLQDVDEEGRQVIRPAAGKKGWTYLAHPLEITTSTIGGIFSQDFLGNNRTDVDIELYDGSDQLITDQPTADTDCVKTVVTFKPDYDIEIISGNIHQSEKPTSDIRVWVIGGAFAVATNSPISVKEFLSGLNMKYLGIDDHIETDGRASKYMRKDISSLGLPLPTYQGNCFQFIIKHDAGTKHGIMSVFEYFRG